jgi:hypothetical protein
VRKLRTGATRRDREPQSKTIKPGAIIPNCFFVEDHIQLAAAFDIDQTASPFDGRFRFVSQCQLNDCKPCAAAR